jgi:thioredoxin 1
LEADVSLFSVIAVVLLVFIGFRYFMMFKLKFKRGKEAPELSGRYDEAVRSGQAALFYFYSQNCGACKAMTPVVRELAGEKKNCFLVDVQSDMVTPGAFGVMATPSTVIVEGGKIKEFLVGAKSKEKLASLMG